MELEESIKCTMVRNNGTDGESDNAVNKGL